MGDILIGDKPKRAIRMVMWWLRKKYGLEKHNKDVVHNDMQYCSNQIIRKIFNIIKDTASNVKMDYQRGMITDFSELGLWIIYKDTAYRPIFFYVLKQILDKKEELMPLIDKYYVEPKDWYVNQWWESKQRTKEGQESGDLGSDELDFLETMFVPQAQFNRFQKTIKELESDMKKEQTRRRWIDNKK